MLSTKVRSGTLPASVEQLGDAVVRYRKDMLGGLTTVSVSAKVTQFLLLMIMI